MTSARKIEANRQNALRSTGPTTAAGRARVAQNALTHGLLAQDTLLPDEDPEGLQMLAETLRAERNPEGAQEHFLVGPDDPGRVATRSGGAHGSRGVDLEAPGDFGGPGRPSGQVV
jgi:hypothetical protein